MSTVGKVITCRAAICWGPLKGQTVEEIQVEPPKNGEVRVKIIANGICRSDAHHLDGDSCDVQLRYPNILGHEAAGIVESIGDGVTTVVPGDHVVMLFMPNCLDGKKCDWCASDKTNQCKMDNFNTTSVMKDGTSRFSHKGQVIYHYSGISTFSEYTVSREESVAKINPKAPLDKACLIGCCVATGYGNVFHVGQVKKGSTCAVWGMGAVGLATASACKLAGASRIIAVDTNKDKFETAKKFGCTEFVNPKELDVSVDKYFQEQLGGVDYAFECVGGAQMRTMTDAFYSLAKWGTLVLCGVTPKDVEWSIKPNALLDGRSIKGSTFGSVKSKETVQKLVEMYLEGKLPVDDLISGYFGIQDIPHCFELLRKGQACRSIVMFEKN